METIPNYKEWQDLAPAAKKESLLNLRRHFDDKDIRELWGLPIKEWYRILTQYGLAVKNQVPQDIDLSVDDRKHRQDHPSVAKQQQQQPVQTEAAEPSGVKLCTVPGCGEKHVAKGLCRKHYYAGKRGQKSKEPQPAMESSYEQHMDQHLDKTFGESVPSDRNWPRSNVVDAEYTVMPDDATKPEKAEQPVYGDRFTPSPMDRQAMDWIKEELSLAVKPEEVGLPFPTIMGNPAQLRKQFEAVSLFLEGQQGEEARFEIKLSVVKA